MLLIVFQHLHFIELNYRRCIASTNRCFVPGCKNVYVNIPKDIRQTWLKENRYFICAKTRCCNAHLNDSNILNTVPTTSYFSPKQQRDLIKLLEKINVPGPVALSVLNSQCKRWTGICKDQVMRVLNELPLLAAKKHGFIILFAYLTKLRTGDTDDRIASLLNITRSTVTKYLKLARTSMASSLTPKYLGFAHLSREQLIDRQTATSRLLFGDNVVLIWDGTYVYIQKSGNYDFQRKTYSMQKQRCLVKPMIAVTPDEYIVEIYGSFKATENDATILMKIMDGAETPRKYLQDGDTFLLDRGFRDALKSLRRNKLTAFMPSFIEPGESQLSWKEANLSRRVTRCRYAIEKVNGYLKNQFKIFNSVQYNSTLSHLDVDFRNAGALYNMFYYNGYNNERAEEDEMLANLLLNRLNQPNNSEKMVKKEFRYYNNRNKANIFFPTDHVSIRFPKVTENDLKLISLGVYQIEQSQKYLFDHEVSGVFNLELHMANFNEEWIRGALTKHHILVNSPQLIRGKMKSRHSNSSLYYVYIILDLDHIEEGLSSIKGYYCDCKNGSRTAGCCSHIMCLMWFLGYGQHNLETIRKVGRKHDQFFDNPFPGKNNLEVFLTFFTGQNPAIYINFFSLSTQHEKSNRISRIS